MVKKFSLLFLLFFSLTSKSFENAITFGFDANGRLGDKLILYIKAKWLSYKYNIPLLFKPFEKSDQFIFHHKEEHYNNDINLRPVLNIRDDMSCNFQKKGMMYEIHHFFQSQYWQDNFDITQWTDLLYDKVFINQLKQLIKPINELPRLVLPEDKIAVAVHVRKGTGFDIPMLAENKRLPGQKYAEEYWPLKFPNDEYYISQIKYLSDLLNNVPLYVFIFTDDPNPQRIIEKYEEQVNKKNIIFDCRRVGNHHTANVIEDFFALTQFKYFIRSLSNFAQVAHLIGDYKIVISPHRGYVTDKGLIVEEVVVTKKEEDKLCIEIVNTNIMS